MSEIQPLKIATFCENIISEYTAFPVKISPESQNIYETTYSLNSSNKSDFTNPVIAISDRGDRKLRVFPLNLDVIENFWLYFSILFDVNSSNKKPNFTFKGVTIQIFKGIATDENKELLFRAEWDYKSEGNTPMHPHPHWHIHFVKEQFPPKVRENFQDFLELVDSDTKSFLEEDNLKVIKKFDISRFHFAMGAKWDLETKSSHQTDLNEKSLKNWLRYILTHIKEQIEYCAS